MEFDFGDAAHNVIFEHDNAWRVMQPKYVQQLRIVAKNLVTLFGNNHDGRFVEKVNHVADGLTVNFERNKFTGQNRHTKALFLAFIVAESFVGIR